MCVVYVAEEHDQILELWRAQQAQGVRLLHLDYHCDMRGLLIDRKAQQAHRIWDIKSTVDQGNFLAYAILEGRIGSVRWVHEEPGGRQYDVGTVKYESDVTALPYRVLLALRGERGVPIHYEVIPYRQWAGLLEGEHLDIDWDFFACTAYPAGTIQDRAVAFLRTHLRAVPDQVYVSYSPDFSHPSRALFRQFVADLAENLEASVVELQPSRSPAARVPVYKRIMPARLFRLTRKIYYLANLRFRKWGIY
jgi:hypothetical protein